MVLCVFVGSGVSDTLVMSGAVVSMVQVVLAGFGSTFPAWSIARTSKVCEPSPRPV
jgi:hypothetical protein